MSYLPLSPPHAARLGAGVDAVGDGGGDLMTDGEHVVIPTLVERAALLATILHRLASGAWAR